jgi:hypothetical protein
MLRGNIATSIYMLSYINIVTRTQRCISTGYGRHFTFELRIRIVIARLSSLGYALGIALVIVFRVRTNGTMHRWRRDSTRC